MTGVGAPSFLRVSRCACTCLPGSCLPVWYPVISMVLSSCPCPRFSECPCVWVSLSLCVSVSVWSAGFPFSPHLFTNRLHSADKMRAVSLLFGVLTCEYHQMGEGGAEPVCPGRGGTAQTGVEGILASGQQQVVQLSPSHSLHTCVPRDPLSSGLGAPSWLPLSV